MDNWTSGLTWTGIKPVWKQVKKKCGGEGGDRAPDYYALSYTTNIKIAGVRLGGQIVVDRNGKVYAGPHGTIGGAGRSVKFGYMNMSTVPYKSDLNSFLSGWGNSLSFGAGGAGAEVNWNDDNVTGRAYGVQDPGASYDRGYNLDPGVDLVDDDCE